MTNYTKWRSLVDEFNYTDAIPDSAVSRWTFDDADISNLTATDVWGNNDATINGATTGESGANQTYTTNEALSFDGTGDNVDTENSFAEQLGDVDASVAMWAKQDNAATNEYIWHGDGGIWFRIRTGPSSSDELEVVTAGTTSTDPDFGLLTSWTHIVLTYDQSAGEISLYRDGGLVETFTGHRLPTSASGTTQIGQGDEGFSSGHWNGDIDDVRVYSKKLTDDEVSNLYNSGLI